MTHEKHTDMHRRATAMSRRSLLLSGLVGGASLVFLPRTLGQEVASAATRGDSARAAAPQAVTWLSGAAGPHAADGSFGSWRGSPVQIGGTWIEAIDAWTLKPGGEWGSFTGPMDVGVKPQTWAGWYEESRGYNDEWFRALFRNLAALRAGRGTTYVRPYYEFNGTWFTYAVRNDDVGHFRTAWRRMAAIAREEFPAAKLNYCAASGEHADVYACWPGSDVVDLGGIDFYNEWPFVTTQAGFDAKIDNGAGHYSLNDLRYFYEQQGVPVAISEWGTMGLVRPASEGGGGESPQFITSFRNWLATYAGTGPGQVLYEIYFNLYPGRFQLYPSSASVQPATANRYTQLF